jgi:cysteinyl-tRNA synthetase
MRKKRAWQQLQQVDEIMRLTRSWTKFLGKRSSLRPISHNAMLLSTIVHVRNSLKHSSTFELSNIKPISWYVCGPTVYDVSHLGHARNYVATDIIRRILTQHFGCFVHFALGMTDVDDKIINKGKAFNCKTLEDFLLLANKYESEYFRDMDRLGVERPHATLRVTEHIDEIIQFVQDLIEKGHAYATQDGVYFRYSSLPKEYEYDKFGNMGEAEEQNGEHVCSEHDKIDRRDFALWKRTGDNEIVCWNSPFGYGRPGWHIECSAMTFSHFGPHLDIHSGGMDLKFPHHNNEIVQRFE